MESIDVEIFPKVLKEIPIYNMISSRWKPFLLLEFLSEEFDVSEEIYHSKMDAIKENLEITKKMEILEDFIWETYFQ